MKPQLYFYESKLGSEAVLVDLDNMFTMEDENGKVRIHYATAIDIGRISPGRIVIKREHDRALLLVYPRPCVWKMIKKMKTADLPARHIEPKAAAVLLDLARAYNNAEVAFSKKEWDIKKPAIRDVPIGWNQWKFIAAWQWSAWESNRMTGAQRHRAIAALGYPNSDGALRKMMADLGLVTHRKPRQ